MSKIPNWIETYLEEVMDTTDYIVTNFNHAFAKGYVEQALSRLSTEQMKRIPKAKTTAELVKGADIDLTN